MYILCECSHQEINCKINCKGWLQINVYKALVFFLKKNFLKFFFIDFCKDYFVCNTILFSSVSYQWTFSLKIESESASIST